MIVSEIAAERKRPLVDRIGENVVNYALLGVYILLFWYGFACFLLVPIQVNQPWPIINATIFVVVALAVHFFIVVVGAVCVPGFLVYGTQPRVAYFLADVALVLAAVVSTLSIFQSPTRSTLPLVSTWVTLIVLAAQCWRVFTILFPMGALGDGASADQ